MATELLEGPQTGAGERERPSVALAPADLYPACAKLRAKLAEFERAQAGSKITKAARRERASMKIVRWKMRS